MYTPRSAQSLLTVEGREENKQDNSSSSSKLNYVTSVSRLGPPTEKNEDTNTPINKRKRIIIYMAIAIFVVAAIVISLGVGLSLRAKKHDATQDNIVHLDYASYRGYKQNNSVSYWKGMRYAAAPTGNLRFAAPQDPPTESNVQDATSVCLIFYLIARLRMLI